MCDFTGNIVRPWSEAGYTCYCFDLQHPSGQTTDERNIIKIGANILDCVSTWMPKDLNPVIAFGFPPCTHTAVAGARHFQSKGPAAAAEAFTLIARVDQLLKWLDCPFFWEQPRSTTITYCGEPTYRFEPCDYGGYLEPPGEAYRKQTLLWAGGGFVMPPPKPVEPIKTCPTGFWNQKMGGKSLRTKNLRSATPKGFSQAVFEFNRLTG